METACRIIAARMIRFGLAGDVMLGRLVDRYVLADRTARPETVWGTTLPLWRAMDVRMVNLECVIATGGEPWTPKAFHFRARPRALEALEAAGIHLVSLANNHVLDFGFEALRECLTLLRASSIRCVGAGDTIEAAGAPAIVPTDRITIAVIAVTDGEREWEAGSDRPGTNYVQGDDRGLVEPYRTRVAGALALARDTADLVIVSAHVGANWGPPTSQTRTLAHQLIDLGADLYWGHSNHTVQGIEIYHRRPILYACGDFIDDYAVDATQRNDLSCLFEIQVDATTASRIVLHPVRIAGLQVNLATGEDVQWLHRWIADRMDECGTHVRATGNQITVEVDV